MANLTRSRSFANVLNQTNKLSNVYPALGGVNSTRGPKGAVIDFSSSEGNSFASFLDFWTSLVLDIRPDSTSCTR